MTELLTPKEVLGLLRPKARGRHKPGEMNKVEREFFAYAKAKIGTEGHALFEAVTLKLGPDLRYTPDVLVVFETGEIIFLDVKGTKKLPNGRETYRSEEDAVVKIRAASERFPFFTFKFAWLTHNGWEEKEF